MSEKIRYRIKTVTVGFTGKSRKLDRLVADGWEIVSTRRYGWSSSKILLRKRKR